jgi:hypothetical protein
MRQPGRALLGRAEALDEEARHHLLARTTLPEKACALDKGGFLACNRDI